MTVLPAWSVSPTMAWVRSSEERMPGKFIISPKPTTLSQPMVPRMSSGPTEDPVSSKPGTAGTQEGVVTMAFKGVRLASSTMHFTPSRPSTLQISWGSIKMPVVPWGMTARAYSPTEIMEDSTWIWPSKKPGAMAAPQALIMWVFSPMQ